MLKRSLALGAAVVMLTGVAVAYNSGEGHLYDLECRVNGYVLTSVYPVARQVGAGAGRELITEIEKIYFGRSCDAFHKLFGTGSWAWANGGFWADFPNHKFRFGGQELFCEPEPDYYLNCGD